MPHNNISKVNKNYNRIPVYLANYSSLGELVDYFPFRRLRITRTISVTLATISLIGSLGVLILGILTTYERYYENGPAVILKYITLPAIVAATLFIIAIIAAYVAYTNWYRGAALFTKGFAISGPSGVIAWRWEDVSSIQASIFRRTFSGGKTGIMHRYILLNRHGKKLVLDDSLERVYTLASMIREKSVPLILNRFSHAFQEGQTIPFGPIRLNKVEGLWVGGDSIPWDQFREATVRKGMVHLGLRDESHGKPGVEIPAADIPNLEVLLSIVDEIP